MLDWNRISELQAEVGDEAFAEVIEIFLEEVEDVLARLAQTGIGAGIPDDMHFLRGSALNLGLGQFAELCNDFELAARSGAPDQIDLAKLSACYEASKSQLLARTQTTRVA